ncbi:MAG: metallophosphoesterase [Thermoanaerobaculales bacterium]|nr:metallophosphoesterase [Thermoanaerobaculales bacterium]
MTKRMQFLVFFATVMGIWLVFHLYVGWRLWSLPVFANPTGHRILLLGLAVLYVSYPLGRYLYHHGFPRVGTVLEYGGGIWMGTLVLLLSALGIVDLVTIFGLVLKPWVAQMRTAAIGIALVLAVVAWIGGIVRPRSVELEVELPNLPASADGLVVAHLTDLHLGALIGERRLRSVIEQIEGMNPDLVVVTGDLVDGDAGAVETMIPVLETLTAPLGVYSILGNHEVYAGPDRCRRLMRDSGFVVLDNEAAEVSPGLWVVGVPDSGRGPGTDGLDGALEAAFAEVGEGGSVIFLQHSPGNEEAAADAGAGLMLNGHTHGGQIWPFHYMVLRAYPRISGVHKIDDMTQVISRGAGRWGAPMRLFAPSEIYRITLRSPDAS